VSIGTANPIPALAPEGLTIAVFTPISSPFEFKRGPPELPGLIEASVWITPCIFRPLTAVISRCRALTIPVVRVWSNPNGLPIAKTFWPTNRLLDVPIFIGLNFSTGAFIFNTAKSLDWSIPTMLAS